MATIFGLTANMDIKTLAHVVELRNKDGLHVDYKYGLRVGGRYDWDFPFPSPKYDGCSIRLFIYNNVSSKAKIRIALERNPAYYYASIEVRGTIAYVSYSNGKRQRGLETSEGSIGLGKYFSIGLRMDGNLFRPLLHKQLVQQLDMKIPVNQYNWNAKIYSGENYILSLHICDEVGKNFPPRGLNERYAFGFVLPIGSYVTVFAVFAGGTPDGQRCPQLYRSSTDRNKHRKVFLTS